MIFDKNVGPDAVGRAVSIMIEAGRQGVDWAALGRVVGRHRHELVERRRDSRAVDDWLGITDSGDRLAAPVEDLEALALKVDTILLTTIVRFGQAWQRMLERQAPELRRCLERCQADDDPSEEDRADVIWQLRSLFNDMGALMRDHASWFENDLRRIQEEMLPYEEVRLD